MSEYLLSVYMDQEDPAAGVAPEDIARLYAQVDKFNQEIQAAGAWVFAGGLEPITTATVVRTGAGGVAITDGPYVETKEYLGGFWVVKAPDLDAALDMATRASAACEGPVEVRPFQDEPEQ